MATPSHSKFCMELRKKSGSSKIGSMKHKHEKVPKRHQSTELEQGNERGVVSWIDIVEEVVNVDHIGELDKKLDEVQIQLLNFTKRLKNHITMSIK